MDRETALALLRDHAPELKAAGVARISVFGSVARGDARPESDVDVVVGLGDAASQGGFSYFGRHDALSQLLRDILGVPVDVVTEPVRHDRLRRAIERESARAF